MKRVVIDASILLSALTGHPEAPPAMLLNAVYERTVEAVACPYLIEEVHTAKAELIVTGDKDLLEHIGLQPPAINARNACELLGLIELS